MFPGLAPLVRLLCGGNSPWALTVLSILWLPFGWVPDGTLGTYAEAVVRFLAALARAAVGLGLLGLMARTHRALHQCADRARALLIAAVVGNALMLGLLSLTHEYWQPVVTNHVARMYSLTNALTRAPTWVVENQELWLRAWSHGLVFLWELATLTVLTAIQVSAGRRLGDHPRRSLTLGSILCFAALLTSVWLCPWIHFDFDIFEGDMVLVALLLDPLPFLLAPTSYTALAIPCYWVVWLSCSWMLRRTVSPAVAAHRVSAR
jgi:hypothetical protein